MGGAVEGTVAVIQICEALDLLWSDKYLREAATRKLPLELAGDSSGEREGGGLSTWAG